MNFLEKLTYWGPLVVLGFLCAAISIFLLFVVWGGVTLGFTAARVIVLVLIGVVDAFFLRILWKMYGPNSKT